MPVLVFAAFQLGRGSLVLPFFTLTPTSIPSPSPAPSVAPTPVPYSRSGTLKIAKGTTVKYVLALKNGENVLLETPNPADLAKYQNKQVLVTGYYNRNANSIAVSEIAQIEVITDTIIPTPTPSAPAQSTSSAN